MNVSFTSTYRVPFKQPRKGMTPSKKDALKELATSYGGIVPRFREGNVKFSCRRRFDKLVEATLNKLGFNSYKKVEIHNVPQGQIIDALEYKGRFATEKAEQKGIEFSREEYPEEYLTENDEEV